eukprot:COSAG06_NODE_2221_length_7313_cov_6.831577_4_plen_77_part_00
MEGRLRSCESSLWMALSCAASSVVLMVSGEAQGKAACGATRVRCDNAPGELDNATDEELDGLRCTESITPINQVPD